MKKPLLTTAAGAALLAAGYWIGISQTTSEASGSKQKSVKAGGPSPASESASRLVVASSDNDIQPFIAGRPFAKGGAKAWLLALASRLGKDVHGEEAEMADMAQVFMTMDEACAAETCEALIEILALRKAGDPAIKAIGINGDMADAAYTLAVFRLSQFNPAAAINALKNMPQEIHREAIKLVFGRLAGQSLARAEEMVPSLRANQQTDAIRGIFEAIAGKDPIAALDLVEKYPTHLGGNYDRVLTSLMKSDPQQGIAAAVRLAERTQDGDAVRRALRTWLREDQSAALAWAGQHTGPGQTAIKAVIIAQQAEADPQAALQEFAKLEPTVTKKEELIDAAKAIAAQLARKEPAFAQTWIKTLADDRVRASATTELAIVWVTEDPIAASEWIKTLPVGSVRDEAARTLVRTITSRDPASSYEWASSISNEASRVETMYQVMLVWKSQDPEAAKAAEAASGASLDRPAGIR